MFFNGLFKCKRTTFIKASDLMKKDKTLSLEEAKKIADSKNKDKMSITEKNLYHKFYKTIDEIEEKMNSPQNKNKILEPSANKKIKYILFMILILYSFITIKPVSEYGENGILPMALLAPRSWRCFIRNLYKW